MPYSRTKPVGNTSVKEERQTDPDNTPGERLTRGYCLCFSMKNTEIERKQRQHKCGKTNPEAWSTNRFHYERVPFLSCVGRVRYSSRFTWLMPNLRLLACC